jgi:hypothetical protein
MNKKELLKQERKKKVAGDLTRITHPIDASNVIHPE